MSAMRNKRIPIECVFVNKLLIDQVRPGLLLGFVDVVKGLKVVSYLVRPFF